MPFTPGQAQVLLVVHAAATWFLVGLIWFVQMVHYPLLARLPATDRASLAALHANLTSIVVAPVMLIEAATAVLIALTSHTLGVRSNLGWIGVELLVAVWISTFLVQVPLHTKLQAGSDTAGASLVLTNWVRTVAWSARGLVAGLMLLSLLTASSTPASVATP